ncbi:MAG: zf-HC2 domain-containing protein [candidate division WOR-3 bacterium]
MRHCDDDVLSRYVDGELDPSEKAEVDKHISDCAQCREAIADLELLRGAAGAMLELEPPARVLRRILEHVGSSARNQVRLRWLLAGVSALAAAVVVALAVASRQQLGSRTAAEGLRLQVRVRHAAVDSVEPGLTAIPVLGPNVVPTAGARLAARTVRIEKVTSSEVGVEPDDVVLAAAAEYRRYLDGVDSAIIECEETMRSNPGYPRVRLVHAQARARAVVAIEQLIRESDR